MGTRFFASILLVSVVAGVVACRSKPQAAPPPPTPLPDSAAAALRWVEAHSTAFHGMDSVASPNERAMLVDLAANARLIGFSELTEGTHEFAYAVRRALFALADSAKVRGLAIQASMADAMEIDRYVRTGIGDPQRLLRTLGSWRWETQEFRALVEAMRAYNQGKPHERQIGFYGFEIPTAAHAVSVITSLPDSIITAPLKAWLTREYACVAINEGAQWGREGRAADSSYWRACGPATVAAADSVSALRRRANLSPRSAADLAFADQMAKLVAHHVRIGLRHLKREELNAEHVLFLADLIGADNQLMLWGGDVEMGRLVLDTTTVQTAVPLGAKLGDRFRTIAFAFGNGAVRARLMSAVPRAGGQVGLSDVTVRPPLPGTYEDVFVRSARDGYWVDFRRLGTDTAGTWLKGPRPMRLITEQYSTVSPELLQTPVQFPKYFDAVVYIQTVTPSRQ
ncbi:MAG TPA: erythromycin esterase family protein [Gemmatimonadaceae bacterium]